MVIGLTSWWVGCWSRILKFPVHQNRVGRKVFSGLYEFIWIDGKIHPRYIQAHTVFQKPNIFHCLGLQGVWTYPLEPSKAHPACYCPCHNHHHPGFCDDFSYTSPRRLDRLPTNLIEGSLLFVFLRLMYLKMSSPCISFAKLNYLWILRSLPSTIFQRHLFCFFKNQQPTLPKKVLAKWCGCTG